MGLFREGVAVALQVTLLFSVASGIAGCRKKQAAEGVDPFAPAVLDQLSSKLEGTWVVGGSSYGAREVWSISGNDILVWDGNAEERGTIRMTSPCWAEISIPTAGSRTVKLTWDGDTLYAGLGNAGVRLGRTVVACVFDAVYVLQDGTCTRVKDGERAPVSCSVKDDHFRIEGEHYDLVVKGAALFDEQMQGNRGTKASSLDEAKGLLSR